MSHQKEDQTPNHKSLYEESTKIPMKARPRSLFVPNSDKSWSSVNPEYFIGKTVFIKLPREAEFIEYIIKGYDPKQEMHCLLPIDSEVDDTYSCWIDFIEIPSEDIIWKSQINDLANSLEKMTLLMPSHTSKL